MKILVLGGSGFLGSSVSDFLSKKGHKVTIFDQRKSKWIKKGQKFIKGNIDNINLLKKAIKKKDIVYNFAAVSDIEEANKKLFHTTNTNIIANLKVLKICSECKVKRYVFASTIYVYSSQGGYYRISKQCSELFIEEFSKQNKLDYTILRYGSIYGSRASKKNGINKILNKVLKQKKLEYEGSPKSVRNFIHIDDVSSLSIEILKEKYKNKHVLINGNKSYKIKDLLLLIKKKLGINKKLIFKNIKGKAHYDVSPYNYIPKKNLILKKNKYHNVKNYIIVNLKKKQYR